MLLSCHFRCPAPLGMPSASRLRLICKKTGPFQVLPVDTADDLSLRRFNDQIAVSVLRVPKKPVVVDLHLALLIAELDAHADIGG